MIPIEAQAACGHFNAFSGTLLFGHMEMDTLEGNLAEFAKACAPSGIGIGIGGPDSVLEVDGFDRDLGLIQGKEEGRAIRSAGEADPERRRAVA